MNNFNSLDSKPEDGVFLKNDIFFFNHSRQNNLTNGENELVKIFALLYPYHIKHSR